MVCYVKTAATIATWIVAVTIGLVIASLSCHSAMSQGMPCLLRAGIDDRGIAVEMLRMTTFTDLLGE